MVAYVFPSREGGALRTAATSLTLRPAYRGRARHARVGEQLELDVNVKRGRLRVALARCVARATVHIDAGGLVRVLDLQHQGGRGERIGRILQAAENGRREPGPALQLLADMAGGYPDWLSLFRARAEAQGYASPGIVTCELIAWVLQ